MPAEPALGNIKDLCGGAGFRRVVYVDDVFDPSIDRIKDLIADQPEATLRTIVELGLAEVDDAHIYDSANAVASRLNTPTEKQALYAKLAAVSNAENPARGDAVAVSALQAQLAGMTDGVSRLSMTEWVQQREALIAEAVEKPMLFVFDDDFTLEGFATDAGRKELQWVRSKLSGKRHATVLLTHAVNEGAGEDEFEHELQQADKAAGALTVVISKKPLQQGAEPLVRRVKYALLKSDVVSLKQRILKALDVAAKEALKEIDALDVEQFERIIVHSSKNEGAWCPETVTRMIMVIQEKALRLRLRTDEEVHKVVALIEPLATVNTGTPNAAVRQQACKLQHSEVIDSEQDVVRAFLPLDMGDIFQWGDKQYVLVAQSCDLAVRSDGKRSRDEHRLVALVELEAALPWGGGASASGTTAPAAASGGTSPVASGEAELALDESGDRFAIANGRPAGESLFGRFSRITYLPPWILDMTVISGDGSCTLKSSGPIPATLQASWQRRVGVLRQLVAKEVISVYGKTATATGVTSTDRDRLARSLLRLPLGCKFRPTIDVSGSDWTLAISEFKRIGRVRERYAGPVLVALTQFIARPAYPHPLTQLG